MNGTDHTEHDEFESGPELAGLDDSVVELFVDPAMWDQPSANLGDRVVDAIRSESALHDPSPIAPIVPIRRGWVRPALLGAAAAVVLLFGGIVVLSAINGVEDRTTISSELISTGLVANVSGDVEISVFDSGLRIDLAAPDLPRRDHGNFYAGWLLTIDGNLVPVGTFHEGDDVTLWAGVGLDQVEAFTITLEANATGQSPDQGSSGDVVLRTLVDN